MLSYIATISFQVNILHLVIAQIIVVTPNGSLVTPVVRTLAIEHYPTSPFGDAVVARYIDGT